MLTLLANTIKTHQAEMRTRELGYEVNGRIDELVSAKVTVAKTEGIVRGAAVADPEIAPLAAAVAPDVAVVLPDPVANPEGTPTTGRVSPASR
jgi:hypothetical protein